MNKYTTKGLPWSDGVGTDVSMCTTAEEAIKTANLDYTVNKCSLVAKMPFTINGNNDVDDSPNNFIHNGYIYKSCPRCYGTYRTDNNIPLGFVKEKYNVVQNKEAFAFFDDAIGKDKAIWDRAGLFGHGQKIFITAKLPNTMKIGNDEINNYLVFSNSHDGSSAITIMFTPIRVICTNMLAGAIYNSNSYIKIRHTATVKNKIQKGAEILRIAAEHATLVKELYDSLLTIKMSDEDTKRYLANLQLTETEQQELLNYDSTNGYNRLFNRDYNVIEKTQISSRKLNTIINMYQYYHEGIGQQHVLGTAWGAYNAVTGYYSNVANLEGEKRNESLLYGGANKNLYKAIQTIVA